MISRGVLQLHIMQMSPLDIVTVIKWVRVIIKALYGQALNTNLSKERISPYHESMFRYCSESL